MDDTPNAQLPTIRFELDPLGPLPANYSQVGEDEWRTEPMTLLEAVIAQAAERLVDHAKREGVKDPYKTLVERVRNIRDEEIREAVKPIIRAAMQRSVQPTNGLGEPAGEPKTLNELIVDEATKQLTSTAKTSTTDFRRRDQTVLEAVIAEQVGAALNKELKTALEGAKAEVLAAVREKGNEVLTEALARAMPRV